MEPPDRPHTSIQELKIFFNRKNYFDKNQHRKKSSLKEIDRSPLNNIRLFKRGGHKTYYSPENLNSG